MSQGTGNLVWLASYPRSGNTWLRVLLTHLIDDCHETADINALAIGRHAASRRLINALEHCLASELTLEELDTLRPEAYRQFAARHPELRFLKTHDAYDDTTRGEPRFPAETTRMVVYLIRNPLDVALSFAHHQGMGMSDAIECMNSNYVFAGNEEQFHHQVRQYLPDWSQHVRSWIEQTRLPVLVVRYEDLHDKPLASLRRILSQLELSFDAPMLERAIDLARFERLQRQEITRGFYEKPKTAARFFRTGKTGEWRRFLDAEQVDRICRHHEAMMQRFGYLNVAGHPEPRSAPMKNYSAR